MILGNQLPRIKVLQINTTPNKVIAPVLSSAVLSLKNKQLPLRSLIIWGMAAVDPESPLDITDRDFATIIRSSPNLHTLVIRETVNFPWGASIPSSLTTLRLDNVKLPTLQSFLDSLRCLPRLQELHLTFCFPKDHVHRPPIPTHSIDFPCLTDFTLNCVDLATESFFRYINIPYTTRLSFHCRTRPEQPSSRPVLGYLLDHLTHSDWRFKWPPIRRLGVAFFSLRVSLYVWPASQHITGTTFDEWKKATKYEGSPISLSFEWGLMAPSPSPRSLSARWPQESITNLFTDVFRYLPLPHLQVLSFENYSLDVMPAGDFAQFFTGLSEVVLLKAKSWDTSLWDGLLQAQQRPRRESEDGLASSTTPLPSLQYIQVTTVADAHHHRRDKEGEEAGLRLIRHWLKERLSSSAPRVQQLDFVIWEADVGEDLCGFEGLVDVVTYSRDEDSDLDDD